MKPDKRQASLREAGFPVSQFYEPGIIATFPNGKRFSITVKEIG